MNTNTHTHTSTAQGNNYPTYFLGRPRAQYENRYHPDRHVHVAPVHRIFSVDTDATATLQLAA